MVIRATRVQYKLTNGMKRVAWVIKKNEVGDERNIGISCILWFANLKP